MSSESSFYQTGGSVELGDPSYVERRADEELYEALAAGQFCYVLTSRQTGKSSLSVRTAARLRAAGRSVAHIDLTSIGRILTAEQWYAGLLYRLGVQLNRSRELDALWHEHQALGCLQRFFACIEAVLLAGQDDPGPTDADPARTDRRSGRPIVIFFDEIDAVRGLPFKTDEFFAGIRECYNRRAHEPDFRRLTFCLLGVARPTDLIEDTNLTPFNIGRQIELTDFTEAEAAPLSAGLQLGGPGTRGRSRSRARSLLRRVLYWTGGHPYLTQKICRCVASEPAAQRPGDVDRICSEIFFTQSAREKDGNLLFVRERVLRGADDLADVLELYSRVLRGRPVADDPASEKVSLLRLAGIAKAERGRLRLRNRIYARVFDQDWVRAQMPDAEDRRQAAAYRRGVLRAGAVAAIVLALVGGLAIAAWQAEQHARRWAREARQNAREARLNQYTAEMTLALRAWEERNYGSAAELLERQRPRPGEVGLRGWEWGYLWRLLHRDLRTLTGHKALILSVAYSPDGQTVATGSFDRTVKLWNVRTGEQRATLTRPRMAVFAVAFSPDGRTLAAGTGHLKTPIPAGELVLWDVSAPGGAARELAVVPAASAVQAVAFSLDGKLVAAGGGEAINLWDVAGKRVVRSLTGQWERVTSVAFAPNGRILASGSIDAAIRLWDVESGRLLAKLRDGGDPGLSDSVSFSPDGTRLAAAASNGEVRLWDPASQRLLVKWNAHQEQVHQLAFSPDGRTLATASWDQTIRLWRVPWPGKQPSAMSFLKGHTDLVNSVAFSPDGKTILSGSNDGTAKLWSTTPQAEPQRVEFAAGTRQIAFSPNNRTVAVSIGGGRVALLDTRSGHILRTSKAGSEVNDVAFSPDGKILAAATRDHGTLMWDALSGRVVSRLPGHPGRVLQLAFPPDGTLVATAGVDNMLRLWSVAHARQVEEFRPSSDGGINSIAFSPDGKTLAYSYGNRGGVILRDVATRTDAVLPPEHLDIVYSVAFTPDGTKLATCGWDRRVGIWDRRTLRLIRMLRAHNDYVRQVEFAPPDGRTLLSACDDGKVKLWNVATGMEVAALGKPSEYISDVAFSPDGTVLAISGGPFLRLYRAATLAEADARGGAGGVR